jgi:hypothetical protein
MRNLLIALLFVSGAAQAEAKFEMDNNAGGKIILTDVPCNNGTHNLAYSTRPKGETLQGCWGADSSFVHIRWYSNDLRSYPADAFTYLPTKGDM